MSVLQLNYTGRTATITAVNNCNLHYTIVGGGGGAGGSDSHHGSDGCPGIRIDGIIRLAAGEQLECTVAGGGSPGATGTWKAGGEGGFALNGYSGGTGGRSGNSGSSGSGGGGGGATVLKRPNGELIAIAAGGGGGGGGGNHNYGYIKNAVINNSYGEVWWRNFFPASATNSAYCPFLNNYGVWSSQNTNSIHLTYEVYFETSGTYTFRVSGDNFAYLWLDNGTVNGNANYIGSTPGNNNSNDFNKFYDFDHYVSAGWHTVDVYATNSGGPRSVAAAAFKKSTSNYIWTTRDSSNSRTALKTRGGAGQSRGGDHGGPGGGGGGNRGGMGGLVEYGDVGQASGSTGYSFIRYTEDIDVNSPHTIGSAGAAGLYASGNHFGHDGIAIFSAYQHDLYTRVTRTYREYFWFGRTITNTTWQPMLDVSVKSGSSFIPAKEVYVKDSGVWKRVYGDDTPTYSTGPVVVNNISGLEFPDNPPPVINRNTNIVEDAIDTAADLADGIIDGVGNVVDSAVDVITGGKIICTKLYELGLMDKDIYEADQAFGAQLVEQHPDIYNGYRAWAEIVVDWMNGEGPNMMPWLSDEKRMQITRDWSTKWAKDIATPWAEEMAYKMGRKESGSLSGRMITLVGTPICKVVGVWQRLIGPSNKPAGFIKGLSLIAIFVMFKLVLETCKLIEGKK